MWNLACNICSRVSVILFGVSFSGPDVLSRYDGSVWADCDGVEAMELPYDIQPVHSSDKRSCSFSSLCGLGADGYLAASLHGSEAGLVL